MRSILPGLALAILGCGTPAATNASLGEPCDDTMCAAGLACYHDVQGGECSKPCMADQECGASGVCADGLCHPACASPADCTRDVFQCSAGYCAPIAGPVDMSTDLVASDAGADLAVANDAAMDDLAKIPDLAISDLATPDLATPDLATPDLAAPDLAAPDLATPDLATPDLAIADFAPPPDLSIPPPDFSNVPMDLGFAMTPSCSRRFGDLMDQRTQNVVVDAQDHFFVAGEFKGTIDFDGHVLTSAGANDIFVAKMDSNCQTIWARGFGDAADQIFDYLSPLIALDGSGALYVASYNNGGTVDFGNGLPPVTGATVMVKLDTDGNAVWAHGFAIPGGIVTAIATDGNGNLTLAGYFSGSYSFGGPPVTTPNNTSEAFVARLDPMGNHLWSMASTGDTQGSNVQRAAAVDRDGDVLVTGAFYGSIDFGGGPMVDPDQNINDGGRASSYLVKLSGKDGSHLWSHRYDFSVGISVITDPARNVIFTGILYKPSDFGTGPLNTPGSFLVKLDPLGTTSWGKSFTAGLLTPAVDAAGNIIVGGETNSSIDFGGGPLQPVGGSDPFLAAFGADGTYRYGKLFAGFSLPWVALGPAGDIVMVGNFSGPLDVGLGALQNAVVPDAGPQTQDVFVARFLR
jgi:hypothetical protein